MLDQVTVNDVIVATMAVAGVILAFLNIKEKLGLGKTGKRVEAVEKEVAELKREISEIKQNQESARKENGLIMEALLALVPNDHPVREKLIQHLSYRNG